MGILEDAIALAIRAHADSTDKGGEPYIFHPLRVMLQMATADERIVAVLHDVFEDTAIPLDDPYMARFPAPVMLALDAITKREDEDYETFIGRCGRCTLSRRVKLADLRDNMNLNRIKKPTEADRARNLKYLKAYERLMKLEDGFI